MRVRRRYQVLLVLLVLVGVSYYWLLVDNHEAQVPRVRFDLAEMRRLAEAIPGAKPDRVVVQEVATRAVPGTLLVAGGGLQLNTVTVQSFLLTRAAGDILIDSGMSQSDARSLRFSRYSPANQAKVESAMRRAGLILFTHEHLDHMGGFVRSPAFAEVARKALVTPEQLGGSGRTGALPWPHGWRAMIRPFAFDRMAPVAPGVVLIRTPGHTPGSQMIFVRLGSGREYLFTGDTATMGRSWRWGRARSRLVSSFLAPEDRAAVLGWLRALRELKHRAPSLVIVPGHSPEEIDDPEKPSGIYRDFARMLPPPSPVRQSE